VLSRGRARKDLVGHRVALANQLRAHVRVVFPGVVGLFAEIDSPISLAFLTRFDCQDRADWLSVKRLAAWLAAGGCCCRACRTRCRRRRPTPDRLGAASGCIREVSVGSSVLSRFANELDARRQPEFGVHVGEMALYGARRDEKPCSDVLVGQPFTDQAHDVALGGR
jgi:hypothetical protein